MITLTATVGNQVEGLVVDQQLKDKIWGQLGNGELAAGASDAFKRYMTIAVSVKDSISLQDAAIYVDQHAQRTQ